MSGWSHTTTATRSPAASTRGAPKKSCPSRRTDAAVSPVPVASATTARAGRGSPSLCTSRTASTQVAVRGDAQAAVLCVCARGRRR